MIDDMQNTRLDSFPLRLLVHFSNLLPMFFSEPHRNSLFPMRSRSRISGNVACPVCAIMSAIKGTNDLTILVSP